MHSNSTTSLISGSQVRVLVGGQGRKQCLRTVFAHLSEPERCFCLSEAKGKNREAGSRDFSVRKNTCDDKKTRTPVKATTSRPGGRKEAEKSCDDKHKVPSTNTKFRGSIQTSRHECRYERGLSRPWRSGRSAANRVRYGTLDNHSLPPSTRGRGREIPRSDLCGFD